MIPSNSMFGSIPCPYGVQCNRLYCRFSHSPSGVGDVPNISVEDDPGRSTKYTGTAIVQEEVNYDYAYTGYIGLEQKQAGDEPLLTPATYAQVFEDDDPVEEVYEEPYQPVYQQYEEPPPRKPPPAKPARKTEKKREFSALDSKPRVPVDLGNDEILLGLSATHTNAPSSVATVKKTQEKKAPTFSQKVLKQYDPMRPRAEPKAAPRFAQQRTLRPITTTKPAAVAAKPANAEKLDPTARKPMSSRERFTIGAPALPKRPIPVSTAKEALFGDEPLAKRPAVNIEQEMREIEVLEKKMKLLKEYKKMAEEVAEMEERNRRLSDPNASTSGENGGDVKKPASIKLPSELASSGPLSLNARRVSNEKPQIMLNKKITPRMQVANRMAASSSATAAEPKKIALSSDYGKTTAASSRSKFGDGERTAHLNHTRQLAVLDPHNVKISIPFRTKFLQMLHKEFLNQKIPFDDAVEMAQLEEKAILDKSTTQTGYTSACAGVVRRIRTKDFLKAKVVPTPGNPTKPLTITEVLQNERNAKPVLNESKFYDYLSKYVIQSVEMGVNGYPQVAKDPETGKKFVTITRAEQQKLFHEADDLRRVCCRCGANYTLQPDGTAIATEECIYHHRRPFKKRSTSGVSFAMFAPSHFNKTLESRYGCCDSDLTVKGCVVASSHVHHSMRRSVLEDFARTPPSSGATDPRSRRVYALDCEMVYTTWGMSLARLSVVDIHNELVLDVLVRPADKILDCNTKFSGLTDADIMSAEANLDRARRKLFKLVNSETILIGHSLESDLVALRLVHNRCVDTSLVFPHRLGPPMKRALRNLASEYLQKIIQEDTAGHDSKEDAATCMELMAQKYRTETGT